VPREAVTRKLLQLHMESDHSACIYFLSKDAFLYYLPAFVALVVEEFEELDLLPFSLIWYFTGHLEPGADNADAKVQEVLSELTAREVDGLRWFAEFLRTHHEDAFVDGSLDRFDQVLESCASAREEASSKGAPN
jgi:hypothetical protein